MSSPDKPSSFSDEALSEKTLAFRARNRELVGYDLPELPDAEVNEIFERLTEAERVASPDLTKAGYKAGSAEVDDELLTLEGAQSASLLTAEHATDHVRNGERKEADWGVGGLVQVIHDLHSVSGLIAVGRQTMDPNYDAEHPFKTEMSRIITRVRPVSVIGVHGLSSGYFGHPDDDAPYDLIIGKGDNPTDKSNELAERVRDHAKSLGMRAGINEPHIVFKGVKGKPPMPVYKEDGDLKRITFKAAGANTTRSHAQSELSDLGLPSAALQIEFAPSLHILPVDSSVKQGRTPERAYLGYLVARHLIEQRDL